jgi:hypothetical protein
MENKEVKTWHILLFMGLCAFMVYMIYYKPETHYVVVDNKCKEDSLQSVINQLQIELESQENGFDKKESRYESILFEYEYGINWLKEKHPDAYREFHRIIAMKERYSIEANKENNKRLKSYEQY